MCPAGTNVVGWGKGTRKWHVQAECSVFPFWPPQGALVVWAEGVSPGRGGFSVSGEMVEFPGKTKFKHLTSHK